jgi:hypothetical protein
MTAHQNGKWDRPIGFKTLSRLPQHQHWCYKCGTAHRHGEECREVGKKRIEEKAPARRALASLTVPTTASGAARRRPPFGSPGATRAHPTEP